MGKKNWDSDWIHFSKKARRGVFVLLILFTSVSVAPRLYYNYIYSPPEYDIEIKPILAVNTGVDSIQKNKQESKFTQPIDMFNPNDYSLEEWMDIGLSQKQAASILKYLNSGAVLRKKEDVKKLYVIDDELYALLAPKINLPDEIIKPTKSSSPSDKYEKNDSPKPKKELPTEKEKVNPVSINTASDWDLKKIPGIGPYFAKEIIKIREAYGGIISYDQLFDIYLMDEEKLEKLKPYLIIDENEIRKININIASEKELRDHPLVSYDMAKSIVFFRENHRPYKRIDEIILSPYIDGKKFEELKPYLKTE